MEVTVEECIELILAKREADSKKLIKSFAEDATVQVLNGRFGPYIYKDGNNYRIPKTTDPETLSLEDCLKLVAEQGEKPARKAGGRKFGASKPDKGAAKKAPAKKKTTATKKTVTKKTTATKKKVAPKKKVVKKVE